MAPSSCCSVDKTNAAILPVPNLASHHHLCGSIAVEKIIPMVRPGGKLDPQPGGTVTFPLGWRDGFGSCEEEGPVDAEREEELRYLFKIYSVAFHISPNKDLFFSHKLCLNSVGQEIGDSNEPAVAPAIILAIT